jgi:hypothetical protein
LAATIASIAVHGRRSIDERANFYELGGNSLQALGVLAEIRQTLGVGSPSTCCSSTGCRPRVWQRTSLRAATRPAVSDALF